MQKACNDCVAEAEKLRGCESISEDPEASRQTDEDGEDVVEEDLLTSSMTNKGSNGGCCSAMGECKVLPEKKVEEEGSADLAAKEEEKAFPGEQSFSSKKRRGRKSTTATVGILAVGCTALAVGSVLVLNPKLLSTVLSRLGKR